MQRAEYSGCCGINIISYFKHNYIEGRKLTELQREELRNYLENSIKTSMVGLLLVALNEIQIKDGIEEVLLDVGFQDLTGPFFHPGHGHRITLYGYELHPQKRESYPPWAYLRKTLRRGFKRPDVVKEEPLKRKFG